MHWHAYSEFGSGPRRRLTREQRRLWLAKVHMHRRAGRLTADYEDVAGYLVRRLGDDGRLDPTQATIAAAVGCCDRTVRRALVALRGLGLLGWVRRLVREGWQARQTSNAYELLPGGVPAAPKLRPACGGQSGQLPSKFVIKRAPESGAGLSVEQQIAAAMAWDADWRAKDRPRSAASHPG